MSVCPAGFQTASEPYYETVERPVEAVENDGKRVSLFTFENNLSTVIKLSI